MKTKFDRPGLVEVFVGLIAFAALLVPLGFALGALPQDQPVLLGVVGSTFGGLAGLGAFAMTLGVRIRSLPPFGFTSVSGRWLAIAAGLGILGYGLNLIIQFAYLALLGAGDPQTVLHAAARGGALSFIASLLGGAIFTPFGEEILFRGVVANALNRYGAWAGVGLSSIIFGLVHGLSVILPVAIMVGLLSALIFRRTECIWPSVVLHCVYNGANSFASAMGFAPMQ